MILACVRGTNSKAVNLGCGYGITIRDLVETLQKITPFEACFDTSKPSGFPKRVMDGATAKRIIGFEPEISLPKGLKQTWEWYLGNADEHERKVNYFRA